MTTIQPKLYVLQYHYVENAIEKRAPYRPAHFAKHLESGNIV
jgi:hypothetical protein